MRNMERDFENENHQDIFELACELDENHNISFEYDENIISRINEILEDGWQELKSFVKSKITSKFEIYRDLDQKFEDITKNIRNLKFFQNEFNYLLFVRSKILYIIYQNCKDTSFGHVDFALDLFDFFVEIWDAKLNFESKDQYDSLQKEFKQKQFKFKREFYWNIYQYSDDFNENDMYEFARGLRGRLYEFFS